MESQNKSINKNQKEISIEEYKCNDNASHNSQKALSIKENHTSLIQNSSIAQKHTKLLNINHANTILNIKFQSLQKIAEATKSESKSVQDQLQNCRADIWEKRNQTFNVAMQFYKDHNWTSYYKRFEEEDRAKQIKKNENAFEKTIQFNNLQIEVKNLQQTLQMCNEEIEKYKDFDVHREQAEIERLEHEFQRYQQSLENNIKNNLLLENEIRKISYDLQECEKMQALFDEEMETVMSETIELRSILKNRDYTDFTSKPSRKRIKFSSPVVTETILISPNRNENNQGLVSQHSKSNNFIAPNVQEYRQISYPQ